MKTDILNTPCFVWNNQKFCNGELNSRSNKIVNTQQLLGKHTRRNLFNVKIDFCFYTNHGARRYQSLGQTQCYEKERNKEDWKKKKNQIVLRRKWDWRRGKKISAKRHICKVDEWFGKWGEVKIGLVMVRRLHVRILDCVKLRIEADWCQWCGAHTHTHTSLSTFSSSILCPQWRTWFVFPVSFPFFPIQSIRIRHRFRTHLFTQSTINHEKVRCV